MTTSPVLSQRSQIGRKSLGDKLRFNSGIYFLHLSLQEEQRLMVGKLRRASFPKGFYVYVGSAQKNLSQRLARHLRNAGHHKTETTHIAGGATTKSPGGATPHWHIDYLLPHAKILS